MIALTIMINKWLRCQRKGNMLNSNFAWKIKPPFMIYVDFESILEDNGNQNPNECKHVACSYGYKLVCVHDKFSKPFKSYLGKDAVYKFKDV